MNSPVYKFLPPSRSTYLDDQLLRFSQPRALNDPFEAANFQLGQLNEQFISSVNQAVEKDVEMELRSAGELKNLTNEFIDQFGEKVGVLSLSERWNSSLMWSHYTDRHRGYCVGFHRDHSFFTCVTPQKSNLTPVTYGSSRIEFADELKGLGTRMLFYKSIEWAYEEESRVVFYWTRVGPMNFIDGKAEFPAGVPVRLIAVPHDAICELIVGMNADSKLRAQLIQLGTKLGVPVFEAYPSQTKLALDRELISCRANRLTLR
jgi:hypothetical protein